MNNAPIGVFNPASGGLLERVLFNHRPHFLFLCVLITGFLGWQAIHVHLNASFEKMIPTQHPFVINYLQQKDELAGSGNTIRISVETRKGDIFDKAYLDLLRQINDDVYLIPGVDRPFMRSLWTSSTRWTAVTESGLEGGLVIPEDYTGTREDIARTRLNIERSGTVGHLVANNFKSSMLIVPLLHFNPQTQLPLDYRVFNQRIEEIREKYENDDIRIHITGFAKVVGDLIDGLVDVFQFFIVAFVIAAILLLNFTRCVRSTLLVLGCSLMAMIWQLGLMTTLGLNLDPYTILVPFLIFAIGMSHCTQKMNGIMRNIASGLSNIAAARITFRRLFFAGLTALLCDAVGFVVLVSIEIKVIQDLAWMASIGVLVLIVTNLMLLPVLLSYVGISKKAASAYYQNEQKREARTRWFWAFLEYFTQPRGAKITIVVAVLMVAGAYGVSTRLQVGDIDPGVPELRTDSRYNRDNAHIVKNYAASSDIFIVMLKTPYDACTRYETLSLVDELAWQLEQVPGVESTNSLAKLARISSAGFNEGNFKWVALSPNNAVLSGVQQRAPRELKNFDCSLLTLYVYLHDHKASTLNRVMQVVQNFISENPSENTEFLLAGGSAGIEAATNQVVAKANREIMLWIYGVVIFLCWVNFRSWRAVLAAVIPLMVTSVLCEALMVMLGIGIKVATLPVISLGVGIGVDYALYVLTILLNRMRQGETLTEAYAKAMHFTGRVVLFTAVTLSLGVGFWGFSPIKFQADMGILLAFMFAWNMVGALVLLPALSYVLMKPFPQSEPESKPKRSDFKQKDSARFRKAG